MAKRDATPGPSAERWWLAAALFLAAAFAIAIASSEDYRKIFNALANGVWITLYVTFVAFGLACALGLLIALAKGSSRRFLREVATFYVEIVRGVPILVLLFYIAFVGAPQLVALLNFLFAPLIGWGLFEPWTVRDLSMTARAVAALTIGYSAFIAEIFRAGVDAVPQGQIEAAKALGLGPWRRFRLIVFPQALKVILPPLGNDLVAMVKDSALVSVLGVQDITQLGKVYASSTFLFFETYNTVAYIYLCATVSLSLAVRGLEARLRRADER